MKDDIGEERLFCSECGVSIRPAVAAMNGGMCTPCRNRQAPAHERLPADAPEGE